MSSDIHICSLVVYARQVQSVAVRLRTLPGLEIRGADDHGKLIVVLEADSEMGLLKQIQEIQNFDEVLAANLVYHHCERAEALEEQSNEDDTP